jgi:hypothetical protein
MVSNKNRKTKYKTMAFQEDAAQEFQDCYDPERETLSDAMRKITKLYKSKCLDHEEVKA